MRTSSAPTTPVSHWVPPSIVRWWRRWRRGRRKSKCVQRRAQSPGPRIQRSTPLERRSLAVASICELPRGSTCWPRYRSKAGSSSANTGNSAMASMINNSCHLNSVSLSEPRVAVRPLGPSLSLRRWAREAPVHPHLQNSTLAAKRSERLRACPIVCRATVLSDCPEAILPVLREDLPYLDRNRSSRCDQKRQSGHSARVSREAVVRRELAGGSMAPPRR